VKIAYDRKTGAPDYFLDDGKPLDPEDAVSIGLGQDRAPSGGYFAGVDFDEHGNILKE
jgi:hypothetical protein